MAGDNDRLACFRGMPRLKNADPADASLRGIVGWEGLLKVERLVQGALVHAHSPLTSRTWGTPAGRQNRSKRARIVKVKTRFWLAEHAVLGRKDLTEPVWRRPGVQALLPQVPSTIITAKTPGE